MIAPILEMRGIAHRFRGLDVLADVSLNIAAGQFVSILGPSGAGKSTILRILTGGQQPDRGEILFEGAPLEERRRPFAFMPQRDALMPWRRVLDNTTLGLEVQGVKRAEARQRVLPLFAEFGLEGFETHYPSELSGGMRQRAALLRTVVQERPMMLLDEPFGALDALTRFGMQRWLEAMWTHHSWTAILVTHDVREAVALSDRIYVLSPRPARIVHEIEIDLPRPRTVAGPHQPQMTAIENTILELLLHPKEE